MPTKSLFNKVNVSDLCEYISNFLSTLIEQEIMRGLNIAVPLIINVKVHN